MDAPSLTVDVCRNVLIKLFHNNNNNNNDNDNDNDNNNDNNNDNI